MILVDSVCFRRSHFIVYYVSQRNARGKLYRYLDAKFSSLSEVLLLVQKQRAPVCEERAARKVSTTFLFSQGCSMVHFSRRPTLHALAGDANFNTIYPDNKTSFLSARLTAIFQSISVSDGSLLERCFTIITRRNRHFTTASPFGRPAFAHAASQATRRFGRSFTRKSSRRFRVKTMSLH